MVLEIGSDGMARFTNVGEDPIVEVVKICNENISEVFFTAAFPAYRARSDELGRYWKLTGEVSFPAVGIDIINQYREEAGVGMIVGLDIKATRHVLEIEFDIWGRSNKERASVKGRIQSLFEKLRFNLMDRGFIDISEVRSKPMGYDETDRIMQFHSTQLNEMLRYKLVMRCWVEQIVPLDSSEIGEPIQQIIGTFYDSDGNVLTTTYDGNEYEETITIGEEDLNIMLVDELNQINGGNLYG